MTGRLPNIIRIACIGGVFARAFPPLHSSAIRSTSARCASSLDSEESKALYVLGQNVGSQLGELTMFDRDELDSILAGMKDAISGTEPAVDVEKYAPLAQSMFMEKQRVLAEAGMKQAGEALTAASAVEGAVTTDSGLVYLSTTEGSGESPTAADTVRVHYEGSLPDGTIFDSSIARGEPIEFPLNRVIAGWTEGLQLMKPGGKATLTIPSKIGYGDRGSPPKIPGGATLIFQVELIEVK
uniref:peptidylprolyl isomerase n=1 Tax=Octactis speculum TaxID=3111310 RepID=A0A7S2D9I4_9STRA|eukprot:CAMPEP_0185795156 /NCGR_PEP_ID=MMETSP1174-20130828/160395_1 /TAXON_ID=35687 /ORGANISM="Dictyocha speculum, Strain CCMP1381" /LENGTH=239 /DNA_ID=CAMNT_0028490433 /DNA_START=24 /DNA_END=743 /DNA_ORIENTATION=-